VISEAELAGALELFEAAPCAYLFTSLDGLILRVNDTFLHWTGYSRAELVNRKRFQDLLSRPGAIFYETHFSPLLRMQGMVKEITVDLVRADGSHLSALMNSKIQPETYENPGLILTSVFDIGERRRYERELLRERRRAEQWALIVEKATDAIVAVDANLNVSAWSRGAESLFGFTPAVAIGATFKKLVVPAEASEVFEQRLAFVREGHPVDYETTLRQVSGNSVEVALSITPHIEPVNQYTGFSAIIRDIGARKKQERTQQMARDLEVANRLAHEINNPLQAIVNCMALLSHNGSTEYLKTAEENLERIAQVIRQLAKVTRCS
jgi:PAS domain S-box-containing protein